MTNQQTNLQASNQNHKSKTSNDSIDISDILQAILQHWRLITSVTLFSVVIGVGLASIFPKEWEAQATLRVGRIQMPAEGYESKLIEDPMQTVERVKLLGFKQKILAHLGLPLEQGINKSSDLLINSLKANAILNTDFVNLSVHGYSPIDAANNMNTAVKEIKKIHLSMEQPLRDKVQNELQANTENLALANIELTNLKSKMAIVEAHKSSSDFAPNILVVNMLVSKEADIRSLKNQEIQYSSQLTSFDAQATSIIDTIHVSKKPVFPKRSIFVALAALFGSLFGIGIAVWKHKD